ncbi:hypothetical protein THI4931_50100 [Pandoraea sputorum]|nr:hypothetical protein THI4931_50100 [Pandoraea sputorum]
MQIGLTPEKHERVGQRLRRHIDVNRGTGLCGGAVVRGLRSGALGLSAQGSQRGEKNQ